MPFMVGREHEGLDTAGIVEDRIVNGFGAFDDEGAFSISSPFFPEELSDARDLCARQQGDRRGQSSRVCYRRFRPDAASAALIRCALALARLRRVSLPRVRSSSC